MSNFADFDDWEGVYVSFNNDGLSILMTFNTIITNGYVRSIWRWTNGSQEPIWYWKLSFPLNLFIQITRFYSICVLICGKIYTWNSLHTAKSSVDWALKPNRHRLQCFSHTRLWTQSEWINSRPVGVQPGTPSVRVFSIHRLRYTRTPSVTRSREIRDVATSGKRRWNPLSVN